MKAIDSLRSKVKIKTATAAQIAHYHYYRDRYDKDLYKLELEREEYIKNWEIDVFYKKGLVQATMNDITSNKKIKKMYDELIMIRKLRKSW